MSKQIKSTTAITKKGFKLRFKELWLYQDLKNPSMIGWFNNTGYFRSKFPDSNSDYVVRVAHQGIPAPSGYQKQGDELALTSVVAIPTMLDLIRSLS